MIEVSTDFYNLKIHLKFFQLYYYKKMFVFLSFFNININIYIIFYKFQ
jgi:hypothetical protein